MQNNRTKIRADLKARLRSRQPVFAGWNSLYHPSITEIFCRSALDLVAIDVEHSTISQEQSLRIMAATQGLGKVCLPRIASHNMEMIKRLLDSGADGMIVPMVNNEQELEQLIAWFKYSPAGRRSFGVARAQGYGFDYDEYVKNWNDSSILIAQIESVEGVENIEKILAHDELDGVMIGPYDLSGSLGIPGQIDHPKVVAARKKVIEACVKHGKACGTQLVDPDRDGLRAALQEGFTFIVLSSDVFLLWKWGERIGKLIGEVRPAGA